MVPPGHWIYDSITALSLESRILNFSTNAPLTIQELKLYLSEFDYDSLSESGKADYDRIFRYFNEVPFRFGTDFLNIGFEPGINPAFFYKTNSDIDWVYDRFSRSKFVEMPVSINCADFFTMKMDLYLGQNRGASLHNFNYTNIPLSADDIDIEFPDTGYLSTGKMLTEKVGVSIQAGSGSKSIGRASTGSIIWSEYMTGAAYVQWQAFSNVFKYTGNISQLNVDKYMYSHQVEARFFKKFTLSFMEGILVYAPLELRYLNPWTVYHGLAAWRDYDSSEDDSESNTCDYFGINIQYTPVKNVRLYGLFAMTQYQTPFEKGSFEEDCTPDGLGVQGGIEVYVPAGNGRLHINAEGSWADPYLYIKESPNWSMVRTYSENMGDHAVFYEWIGSPFGPDTVSGEFKAGYEKPGKWSLGLAYLFMARGEMSGNRIFNKDVWGGSKRPDKGYELYGKNYIWPFPDAHDATVEIPWDEWRTNFASALEKYKHNKENLSYRKKLQNLSSPSGVPEYVNRISIRGTYHANDRISFTAQPSYVLIFNRNNEKYETKHGFEVAAAMNVRFIK